MFFSATPLWLPARGPGRLLPNGSYTGMTGYIQRNEIDTSLWPVRLDSTPQEPGRFVIFPEPEDMPRIFSAFNTSESRDDLDIFYFIENFSSSAWKYFIIVLTLCTVFFVLFESQFQGTFSQPNI